MKKLLLLLVLAAVPAFGHCGPAPGGVPANITASTLALGGATLGSNDLAISGTFNLGGAVFEPNGGAHPYLIVNGVDAYEFGWTAFTLASSLPLQWGATNTVLSTVDTGLSRGAAGVIDVGNGTAGDTSGTLQAALVVTSGSTVAALPAGVIGARYYVTDQLTSCPANGVAPTGGGIVVCPVFYNGAAWVGG